ncbi:MULTISPECIES: hypothetical protein [unclassified Streptomyces]|uniref:hypothetical protein n=1 Tax=unclassified Streptomyces TaxID=2593676 RepID=UPI002E2AFD58|nr:hypothetical protein [Streptomyces sp. NBC_00223]
MNRWVVRHCVDAGIRLRGRTERLVDALAARDAKRSPGADRGQTSFEYLGIAVVIAVIIGVLAGTTDIGDSIMTGIQRAITRITGGS